jgi:hypothetical protein
MDLARFHLLFGNFALVFLFNIAIRGIRVRSLSSLQTQVAYKPESRGLHPTDYWVKPHTASSLTA